jgi:Tol biopolymer transport system component
MYGPKIADLTAINKWSNNAMKHLPKVFYLQLCLCILVFLYTGGCSKKEPGGKPPASAKKAEAETTLLATISEDEEPASDAQMPSGHSGAPSGEVFQIIFSKTGAGAAYSAQKNGKAYVVHNGKAGRPYQALGAMAVSPDGTRIAYAARVNEQWRMVIDGSEGTLYDEVSEPLFSGDSRHIAYQARSGGKWRIVLDGKMSAECASYYNRPSFNDDSEKILYIENTEDAGRVRLVLSALSFKDQKVKELNAALIAVNMDKSRVAASVEKNGRHGVIEFSLADTENVKEGKQYDAILNLAFASDGVSTIYVAQRGGERLIVLGGMEEVLPEGETAGLPVVSPDNKRAGVIMASKEGLFLHQAFTKERPEEKRYEEAADLVYSGDSTMQAYTARKGDSWFIVLNGKEGPAFDRVVTPLFSPDNSRLIYRARKEGKRFVVVADNNGNIIKQHPSYEQVFQPVFTADGKSIAYGVKDGPKLVWKVERLDK